MIKNIFMALALLCAAAPASLLAQTEQARIVCPEEGSLTKFEYQGFSMMIPSNNEVSMTGKEAVVKCTDGSFGMSVKVEKDKEASAEAAVEMCRRMVSELDVKGAKIYRLIVHGMQGGLLEGTTEGAPINVLILDAGGKYLKMVIINTPDRADWVDITIDSVTAL